MKVFVGLLLLAAVVCSTVGLPARGRDPNEEAEYVPSADNFKGFSGVIDTGADFPSPADSFGVPNDGLLTSFSDIMRRFRERLFGNFWNTMPTFNIGDFDPSNGDSTSEVKVIDGHRVEINNTVYTKTSEDGNSVYKVRVVNVRPLDEDDTAVPVDSESSVTNVPKPTTPAIKDREELDNEVGNYDASESSTTPSLESSNTTPSEIEQDVTEPTTPTASELEDVDESVDFMEKPKNTEEDFESRFEKLEMKDDMESKPTSSEEAKETFSTQSQSIRNYPGYKYNYASPLHTEFSEEDSEVDQTYPSQTAPERSEWDSFEEWHTNHENNNIDDFQSIPVDLSNDIEVNQILADQGAPTNPDAEVFAVPAPPQNYNRPTPGVGFQSIRPSSYGWYPSYQPSRVWPKRK